MAGFIQTKGRVVTGAMSKVTKRNFMDTISNILCSKQAFKVYPNPIRQNNALTIEMSKREKGRHLIQLTTSNGQIVVHKECWIEKNDRVINIDIPGVAAGTYLVSVTNEQSGRTTTEKIIVE